MAEFIETSVDEIDTNIDSKPDIAPDLCEADVDLNVRKQPRVSGLIALFNSKSKCPVKRKKPKKQKTKENQIAEDGKEKGLTRHKSRSHSFKRLFTFGRSDAFDLNDSHNERKPLKQQATLDGLTPMSIRNSTLDPSSDAIFEITGTETRADPDDVIVSDVSNDVILLAGEHPSHEIIQRLNERVNKLTKAYKQLSKENLSLSSELETTKNELAMIRGIRSSSLRQFTIDETEEDKDTVTSLKRISQSFDDVDRANCSDETPQTKKRLLKAHSDL